MIDSLVSCRRYEMRLNMELRKNQVITLKIDDLGNNGEGIGHVDGYALFVKDALPGETIRARTVSYTHLTLPTKLGV